MRAATPIDQLNDALDVAADLTDRAEKRAHEFLEKLVADFSMADCLSFLSSISRMGLESSCDVMAKDSAKALVGAMAVTAHVFPMVRKRIETLRALAS